MSIAMTMLSQMWHINYKRIQMTKNVTQTDVFEKYIMTML